jgi:hypothetical protein
VKPFLRIERGVLRVDYLIDPDGRVVAMLDRLCRLVKHLEGCPRDTVAEALKRQERRVRDATRMSGIARALLDACVFQPPVGAAQAPSVRNAVFAARGRRWPPVPGDHAIPYEEASLELGIPREDVERLLYADLPGERILARVPQLDGNRLLSRYNLELARAVLLDAERITLTARGGWRGIFRAVKLARLMYTVERHGRAYRLVVTGPASSFVTRTTRYGVRFARLVPALARAPGWTLTADVRDGDGLVPFRVRGRPRSKTRPSVGATARRPTYDSAWERSLAGELRARFRANPGEWTLHREVSPVALGEEVFLPDFTLRHADGREALVEVVGFWTPEYLAEKLRKVTAARLEHLVLVVYRGLSVGAGSIEDRVGAERVVWFTERPRAAEVLRAVERVARRGEKSAG